MDRSRLTSRFELNQHVMIDGDRSMVGVVTGFQFRGFTTPFTVEVSYFHSGEQKTPWIEEWRLSSAAGGSD